jgi:hypothetical protein
MLVTYSPAHMMQSPLLWAVIIDTKDLPFRSCHFLCLDAKKVTKEKSRLQKNELKFTAFRDNE